MSSACQCDVCGALYAPAVGCVALDSYHVVVKVRDGDPISQGWQCDLCPKCSAEFLKFVKHDEAGPSESAESVTL